MPGVFEKHKRAELMRRALLRNEVRELSGGEGTDPVVPYRSQWPLVI